MKVKDKLLSRYALLESSSFLCTLSLKSLMEQLQVRQIIVALLLNIIPGPHNFISTFLTSYTIDPEDYSAGARRYNVTFSLTAYTDQDDPELTAISEPISFKITKDVTVLEDVEYFQARIVATSSKSQVKIAKPDTVNITIIEDKSESLAILQYQCFHICSIITLALVVCSHQFWCKTHNLYTVMIIIQT